MLAPYFFVRERLKGTEIQFGDLYPIFFLVLSPRIAQERRLGFGSVSFTCKEIERSESRLRAFIEVC